MICNARQMEGPIRTVMDTGGRIVGRPGLIGSSMDGRALDGPGTGRACY
jgi:hypothetical protein